VYKCLNDSGPAYLADSLQRVTNVQSRRRLRSSSSSTLVVLVTRHATRVTVHLQSQPPEHGTPYIPDFVTAAPTVPSHRSGARWRRTCSHGFSDKYNTRHTNFMTCSWSAARLHHANHVVWWWWWWWWRWYVGFLRSSAKPSLWQTACNFTFLDTVRIIYGPVWGVEMHCGPSRHFWGHILYLYIMTPMAIG